MRILVISDSHGNARKLYNVMEAHSDIDTVFFLGDGIREFEELIDIYPNRKMCCVRGNCDFISNRPSTDLYSTCKGLILYTHGDAYGVKSGLGSLIIAAKERGARIALFGHTHKRCAEIHNDVCLFNPGSLGSDGSYGIIEILDDKINMSHYVM